MFQKFLKGGGCEVELERTREGEELFDNIIDSSNLFRHHIGEGKIFLPLGFLLGNEFPPESLKAHADGVGGIAYLMGHPRSQMAEGRQPFGDPDSILHPFHSSQVSVLIDPDQGDVEQSNKETKENGEGHIFFDLRKDGLEFLQTVSHGEERFTLWSEGGGFGHLENALSCFRPITTGKEATL